MRTSAILAALGAVLGAAGPAWPQVIARAPMAPVSPAWGIALRHVLESPSGAALGSSPLAASLRAVDVLIPRQRLAFAPLVGVLSAAGYTPGKFASASPEAVESLLPRALEEAQAGVRAAAAEAAAGPGDPVLLRQFRDHFPDYLDSAGLAAVSRAYEESAAALSEEKRARLGQAMERLETELTRHAPVAPAPPDPVRAEVLGVTGGRQAARLARRLGRGMRQGRDSLAMEPYRSGVWELAERFPEKRVHAAAARSLLRELRRGEPSLARHRLHVVTALEAVGSKTPYERVERRIIQGLLQAEAGGFGADAVGRRAGGAAESLAVMTPFKRNLLEAIRLTRQSLSRAALEEDEAELRRRLERLQAALAFKNPPAWPAWKPAPVKPGLLGYLLRWLRAPWGP